MGIYKTCPHCGAHLDAGEACDCITARYAALSPANRERLDTFAMKLIVEQRASSTGTAH